MVEFSEDAFAKEDHLFVKEDPGRIYRGLKDIQETNSMSHSRKTRSGFTHTKRKARIH